MSTRPPKNYRKFNAPRFLKKFHNGGEPLLKEFFARVLPESPFAIAGELAVDAVIDFVQGDDPEAKEPTRLLNDAYDLGNTQGAFFLRNALNQALVPNAPDFNLIPEHLSLIVLLRWPDVFVSAYDRLGLSRTDNFSFYAGREARPVANVDAVARDFEKKLRELKRSQRVVVRSFTEGEMVNFIFYHEKPPQAPLIIQDDLEITALLHRPAQQDFICYNTRTGHVEVEIGTRGEKASIRKKFAESCTGDAEFFEQPKSTAFLELDKLLAPDFTLNPEVAKLTYLKITLDQEEEPTFEIKSKDVFMTLAANGMLETFQFQATPEDVEPAAPTEAQTNTALAVVAVEPATVEEPAQPRPRRVHEAKLTLTIPGQRRGVGVELVEPNKVSFPRSMHTATVFQILRGIGVMKS